MSKQLKYIMIAAVCVLVLIAGILIVMNLPTEADGDEPAPTDSVVLYAVSLLDVEHLTIQNAQGELTFLPLTESADFTIEGYEEMPLALSTIYNLVHSCRSLTAAKEAGTVSENGSEFGLDKPVAEVDIACLDGTTYHYYIGSPSPLGNGYYGYMEGSDVAYLLPTSLSSVVSADVKVLLSKELIATIDDANLLNIETITLGGSARDEEVVISKHGEEDEKSTLAYWVTAPEKREINSTFLSTALITNFNGLTASEICAVSPTEEEKASYGISDAPYTFHWEGANIDNSLTFGNIEGDYIYVMRPEYHCIYKVETEKIAGVMAPFSDIASTFLDMRFIDTLDVCTLTFGGESYAFTVTGTIDDSDLAASFNGEEISIDAFKKLYTSIISLQHEGEAEPVDGEPLLTIRYDLRSGGEKSFSFYEIDARKCYIKADGEDMNSFLYKKDIDAIIADATTLIAQ